jgi:hypothetical protein
MIERSEKMALLNFIKFEKIVLKEIIRLILIKLVYLVL